MMKQQYLKS